MKKLILCVFLLCSKMLFSQTETKEAFLNQVYKDFIPENYQFFYLKEPFIPKTPSSDFLLGELTLSQIDDYKKIIHAIEKRKKDSIIPSWNFQMLEKRARKCCQDSLLPFSPTINYFIHTRKKMRDEERFKSPSTYIVTVKWYWSKKRRNREEGRVYNKCYELFYKPEKQECYSFSEPIFFEDNKVYLVFHSFFYSVGYVYIKENNIWRRGYEVYRKIS